MSGKMDRPADFKSFPGIKDLPAELFEKILPCLSLQTGPGAGNFPAISLSGVRLAAAFWRLDLKETMIALLERQIWPMRFARNRGVFKAAEQARLLRSRVLVIGCGGLGGSAIILLARIGIGALTLCDYDSFDESNLNRQLLSRENNLGQNKAKAAAAEISLIASHVETEVYPFKARSENLPEMLKGVDMVVDCLDSITTRHQAEAAAHAAGIPFVHGSIAGEEGFVMLCRPGANSMRLIYGESHEADEAGAEKVLGVPTLTPVAVAVLEVNLVVAELLGKAAAEQSLLHLDLSCPVIAELFV